MDLGDSLENADESRYPQQFSALGIRIGIDYIIYAENSENFWGHGPLS